MEWFGVLIECKITPGMELFGQQYFTEQYIILARTEHWSNVGFLAKIQGTLFFILHLILLTILKCLTSLSNCEG